MSRCGICGHTILDLHHCGECVDELRAALARETERAERAERERDEARASEEWLAENQGAAYDMTWREVESLREWKDKLEGDIDALRSALAAATRERDEARACLSAERAIVASLCTHAGELESERDRLRNEVDGVAQQVIYWSKRAGDAERKLAALSHIGTGAGRRAG